MSVIDLDNQAWARFEADEIKRMAAAREKLRKELERQAKQDTVTVKQGKVKHDDN